MERGDNSISHTDKRGLSMKDIQEILIALVCGGIAGAVMVSMVHVLKDVI
jgi:hypothetical protein